MDIKEQTCLNKQYIQDVEKYEASFDEVQK